MSSHAHPGRIASHRRRQPDHLDEHLVAYLLIIGGGLITLLYGVLS